MERQIAQSADPGAKFLFPDSYQFDVYARNLLHRGEYVDDSNRYAWRTPAYSALLAGVYAVAGDNPRAARLCTALNGVLNVWLVYLLGARLFSRRAGLLAASLAAFDPFSIYFSALVLADTLGATAVLLAALCCARWVRPEEPRPLRWAALTGLALAFAVLAKAAFALLPAFYAAFMLARAARRRVPGRDCERRVSHCGLAALALGFALGLAPWWLRNYAVFRSFVPFSTMGGFTLYESNNETADGGPNNGKTALPPLWDDVLDYMRQGKTDKENDIAALDNLIPPPPLFHILYYRLREQLTGEESDDEYLWIFERYAEEANSLTAETDIGSGIFAHWMICRDGFDKNGRGVGGITEKTLLNFTAPAGERFNDALLSRLARLWIVDHPDEFLKLVPKRIARTWNIWPNYEKAAGWQYKLASLCSYVPVMLLACFGAWFYRSRWREVWLLLVPAAYLFCLHAVFMGSVRYRLPAIGCLMVLAAAGLDALLAYLKRHRRSDEISSESR